MRSYRSRRGVSLLEVLAGTTLAAMLVPVTIGTLSATQRIWFQFESGRDSTSNRQSGMYELNRLLASSKRVVSYSANQIQIEDAMGQVHTISSNTSPNGNPSSYDLIDSVGNRNHTLAEGISQLQVRRIEDSASAGELLEVRLDNLPNRLSPPNRQGTTHSSRLIWKRP